MEKLLKIQAFLNKYRWAITWGLFICCIVQQCTISTLRSEVRFLKDKYTLESVAATQQRDLAELQEGEITVQSVESEPADISDPGDVTIRLVNSYDLVITMLWLIAGGVVYFIFAWFISLPPFDVKGTGQLWQELSGRIVYTLRVKNRSRKAVTVSDVVIVFRNFTEKRKFKVPVADFPLMLSKGTSHTVNISLQKLFEQHPELTKYKMVTAYFQCDGKRRGAMPLIVKWKTA